MYRNLFVPVDGSPLSLRAMEASIALAKQLGAAITGFVVEPDAPMPMEGSPLPAYTEATEKHIVRTDTHAHDVLSRFEVMAAPSCLASAMLAAIARRLSGLPSTGTKRLRYMGDFRCFDVVHCRPDAGLALDACQDWCEPSTNTQCASYSGLNCAPRLPAPGGQG